MPAVGGLDQVLETIFVDCYGEDEEYTAFLTVIEDEVPLPVSASLLGTPVTVTGLDYTDPARGLRRSPGRLPSGEFTHAILALPNTGKDPLEVHTGVKLIGKSKVAHEADVLVLPVSDA
jgi:hypothetical protein